ncbi:glycosyltransferase family 39 protein [Stieleria sp. ICT_E10.1]|uniref:ArnT family glycosyltransferase n=1 Tax=Stieleria sedimenti TaxID=2976331 RepID=UPI0021800B68|nr:glycosyltransferase family 39 protein [Stieleria sedimenti]MCS7465543.1 glycosyltransferase family 39 protein [Stieleria sedimenti]
MTDPLEQSERVKGEATHRSRRYRWGISLVISIQFALLCWHAFRSSPVADEYGHLYAGIQYWRQGETELFCVNPPLVRALGSVFAVSHWPGLDDFRPDYAAALHLVPGSRVEERPTARWEWPFGCQLFNAFPDIFRQRLFLGRMLVSLFAVSATVMLYHWGARLFGAAAGLTAAACWAFQPEVLSHGSLITNDIAVAAAMIISCYFFCQWMSSRRWKEALIGGVLLGICTLCKFTSLLLWPIFLGFAIWRFTQVRSPVFVVQAMTAVAMSLIIVGIPYGFDGVGKPLGEIQFLSDGLAGDTATDIPPRYRDRWFAGIPSPVPEHFVIGMDRQQYDFQVGLRGFAAGQSGREGWWWFYLYAMLVKLPTGTLIAVFASLLFGIWRLLDRTQSWNVRFEHSLIACVAVGMIEITAYKSGFARQHRYIFPLYPFLFLLVVAPLALPSAGMTRWVQWTIKAGVVFTVMASLAIAPHWMGAFNALSGGTDRGHFHLHNDASDWGQDCYFLADWIASHPDYRPLQWHPSDPMRYLQPEAFGMPADILQPKGADRKWMIVSKSLLSLNQGLRDSLPTTPVEAIGATHFLYQVEP